MALEGGQKSTLERLAAPDSRARIKAVIVEKIKTDRGAGNPKNVQFANCSFDKTLAGKTLSDATRTRGLEPTIENAAETAMELQSKGGCSAIYHAISEEDVVRIMRSPWTMIASDGEIPVFGAGVAASAQLWHVRARTRSVCARTACRRPRGGGAQDVGLPGPAAEALGPRTVAARHESGRCDLRSGAGSG